MFALRSNPGLKRRNLGHLPSKFYDVLGASKSVWCETRFVYQLV